MPGVNVIYGKGLDQRLISKSLHDLKHEQNYEVIRLFENNNFMLAFTGYEGYPWQYFEDDNTAIFIEGLIYNMSDSQVEQLLKALSRSYIENSDFRNAIREFIDNSDGDFNVVMYFKRLDECIAFNDRWGRLPSYYYHDDNMFIFTREFTFILQFIPQIQFDKIAIVEFLVLEYSLGDKTLVKNIHRVSPSCMFNPKLSEDVLIINAEKVFDVNFEEPPKTLSKNEYIQRCKDLFLQSMNYRINKIKERNYHIIADLSGGQDSRTVMAGLIKFDVKVDYYTIREIMHDETDWAEKIAALYNRKPTKIAAYHDINCHDMSRITFITGCTVNGMTALATYTDSLEIINRVKDVSVRFMGLGSGLMRTPYKKRGLYKTLTDMFKAGYFVRCIKIKHACSIMNLGEEIFYNNLTTYFGECPESTLGGKAQHLHFEYRYKLVQSGENRHRLHFWTVQPLWSKYSYSYEVEYLPAKYSGFDFFIGFMRAVDPILLNAPIYGSSVRLNSRLSLYRAALVIKLVDILHSNSRLLNSSRFIRSIFNRKNKAKHSDICENIKRDILDNYAKLNILSSCLDKKGIYTFIKNERKDLNLYILLTVILYLKEVENIYGDKIVPCESL